ncbi:hypothetical protein V6N13_004248 [Hibiscus sabdariffa]
MAGGEDMGAPKSHNFGVGDTQQIENKREVTGGNAMKYKRIIGHVETEDIWKCKRCLIGKMETICNTSSIMMRLQEWGLGEIRVQRLRGKTFLITIENEDSFMMLEDLNWSYLKEIFVEVTFWSENSHQVD